MSEDTIRAPLSVYMLADHLDATLAAGEDIVALGRDWHDLAAAKIEPVEYTRRERRIAEEVRGYELVLIARILKARDHARALAEADIRFRPIANLFASGTSILLDAVEECGDARGEDFDTGDAIISYVRGRGMIAPDAASVRAATDLVIDDNFMVAKRIALGPLLDMSAAFLDALDSQYELFAAGDEHRAGKLVLESDDFDRAPLN